MTTAQFLSLLQKGDAVIVRGNGRAQTPVPAHALGGAGENGGLFGSEKPKTLLREVIAISKRRGKK
jgi:hypothetical protein